MCNCSSRVIESLIQWQRDNKRLEGTRREWACLVRCVGEPLKRNVGRWPRMQAHVMKRIGCVIAMSLSFILALREPSAAIRSSFNSPVAEYGPICWEDEKARLDNFAFALQNADRTTIGHIIVYDGKRACRGEAVARAIRAKKYLVEYRNVEANRIVWRWGGYLGDMTTTLVTTPRGASIWPLDPPCPPTT